MMPMPMQGGPEGPMKPPMGGGAGGPAGPASEGGQGDIRPQLMQLLAKAADVAAQNGLDFKSIVMEFLRGGGSKSAPPPPPVR